MSADPIILKILNGVQSGVEVALADGTYSFGSGRDDDIQLVDVSLLAGHARLRIAGAKIEISAQSGPLDLAGKRVLEKDGAWHPLEPLDVVVAGTTRFALGPRSTNWASVADQERRSDAAAVESGPSPATRPVGRRFDWRVLVAPVLALVVVAVAVGWLLVRPGSFASGKGLTEAEAVRALREGLDRYPFGRNVEVRNEVDGAIFVNGYVATPVERRALAGAIEKTGVSARVRLYVLDDMRRDLADLVKAQKLPVDFSLSDKGVVTLTGVILNADRAKALEASIRDRVFGVSDLELKTKTADALLGEARELLTASQLNSWLLLRVVGDTLEVGGALPAEKVDAWVGFLQTYASRFAKDLPLRSFVQLQPSAGNAGSTVAMRSAPFGLGGASASGGTTPLDLDKLRKGDFTLGDLFVGTRSADAAGAPQVDRPIVTASATREASSARTPGDRTGAPKPPISDRGAGPLSSDGRNAAFTPPRDQATASAKSLDQSGEAPRPVAVGAGEATVPGGQTGGSPSAAASVAKPIQSGGAPDGASKTDAGQDGTGQGMAQPPAAPSTVQPSPPAVALTGPPAAAPNAVSVALLPASKDGSGDQTALADLRSRAAAVILRFRRSATPNDAMARDIQNAMALIESRENGATTPSGAGRPVADWLLPILSQRGGARGEAQACWPGTDLTAADLLPTVFWLDILSATRTTSLANFTEQQRVLLLDAAFNPDAVRACSQRSPQSAKEVEHSLYLREVARNPEFADYIIRDMPRSNLDVVGVSLGKRRFVLTRDGVRLNEGSAPDRTSRLASVGMLGLVIQRSDGLAVQLFGPSIGWLVAD